MRVDGFSRSGATAFAVKIRDFWTSRGEVVSTWIEEIDRGSLPDKVGATLKDPLFAVRSDLFNGLPRKLLAKAA